MRQREEKTAAEPGGARAMRHPGEPDRRRLLLSLPHIAPLADYAASLRGPGREVPEFDPLDGGTGARAVPVREARPDDVGREGDAESPRLWIHKPRQ